MRTCVIISEYNPFHKGHAWQIDQAKRVLGFDAVICLMSGAFVQRGQPAILPAWDRAACAVHAGASLVLEYPAANVLQSSKTYAFHAVAMATRLGAQTLVFSSEEAALPDLLKAAQSMQTPDFDLRVHQVIQEGKSEASAVRRVLSEYFPQKEHLIAPNATLALAYITAIMAQGSSLEPLVLPRQGAAYTDEKLHQKYSSATAIRQAVYQGHMNLIQDQVPSQSYQALLKAKGAFPTLADYEGIIRYFLTLDPGRFTSNPHYENGLETHLARQMADAEHFKDFLSRACSKRYTRSRIQRLLACSLIGIDQAHPVTAFRPLAADATGRLVLRRLQDQGLPILTRMAHLHELSETEQKTYKSSIRANDLRNLALGLPPGEDYYYHPIFL